MKRLPQRGETLIGLLVGLSVGLVVLTAGSALLAHQLRGHRIALQDSHLNHDLRSAMDWMARELRKAQYSAKAWETRSPITCVDTFCDGFEDFSIEDDWIDFSYDRNHNGLQDDNECMGFRLSGSELSAKRSCSASGSWLAITDRSSLEITAVSWQMNCELRKGWLHRSVRMALTAQWPGDASRQLSLSQIVHLRNDLPAAMQARYCP
jgi:type IV pilus assembly protein PilW